MSDPRLIQVIDTRSTRTRLRKLGLTCLHWKDVDLNLKGRRMGSREMHGRGIEYPHVGFKWTTDDEGTLDWYPQGIAGLRSSPDLDADRKMVVVSWYARDSIAYQGARISLVDVTDMKHIRYRHVLLVQPSGDAAVYQPIAIHAGGVATRGNTLFVADTDNGIRAFDMSCLMETARDLSGLTRCGLFNGRAYAFGYRYILPQQKLYRMSMSQGEGEQNFSYTSVDWTDVDNPLLVTGNYHSSSRRYNNPPAKVVWWSMNGDTITGFDSVYKTELDRTQGAMSLDGNLWLSRSGGGGRELRRIRLSDEADHSFSWPEGCEDLHYSPYSGNLWCLTELPETRFVFAVRLEEYLVV